MEKLRPALSELLADELLKTDKDFSSEAFRIRVIKKFFKVLKIHKKTLQFMLDPETIFIHPQVSDYLIEHFSLDKYKRDYHDAAYVDSICDQLEKITDPESRHKLNIAFAVDGYRGKQLKNYKDNLRLSLTKNDYKVEDWESRYEDKLNAGIAGAIRHLYKTHGPVNSEIIHLALQHAFDGKKSSTDIVNKIAQTYVELIGEENVEEMKEIYENRYVCFKDEKSV